MQITRLERLEQPIDIIELFLRAGGFAGAAAKLLEDLARAGEVRLVGDFDVATRHGTGLVERPPEGIGALALLIIAGAGLLAVGGHDVLRELLGAVAQIVERALLRLFRILQLVAGKAVARLAHLAAGLVKSARHLNAVLAEALDDLVELVAQTLLILSQRVGILPGNGLALLARRWLTLLAELTLAGLPELAEGELAEAALALTLSGLAALLALLPLTLLALALLALTLLPLLPLTPLRAEGPVEQLPLPPQQVAKPLQRVVHRILLRIVLTLLLAALLTRLAAAAGHHLHIFQHL